MGRIKELQEKKAKDGLSDDEEKELKTLITEAKDVTDDEPKDEPQDSPEEDVEAEVDKLANSLVEKVESSLEQKLSKVLEATKEVKPEEVSTKETPTFIVYPAFGKKSVDELADTKIVIEKRKSAGKKNYEVSARTTHFIKALVEADREKLQNLVEGTAGLGGYLVPVEYANMIVEDLRDAVVMRQIADVMTTTSDTFHLPKLDTRPNAAWRSEGAVKQTSTVQWDENIFTPYSLAVIVGLSRELEADASLGVGPSVVSYVTEKMVRDLAEKEDKAFFAGSGSGQPTGMSTYSLGSLDAGLATSTQRADNIQKTYRRLPQGYRNRAVWVANQETWEVIDTLKDGNNNYLLRGLADSPTPVLKGRPVYEQNDIAPGTLYFGDFSYYKIVDREGISVDISREATVASQSAFERNLTFVRVEKRVDGELTLTQPVRKATNMA